MPTFEDFWIDALRTLPKYTDALSAPGAESAFVGHFDIASSPGFSLMVKMQAMEAKVSEAEAEARVKKALAEVEVSGAFCFSAVLNPNTLRDMLALGGLTSSPLAAELAALSPPVGTPSEKGQGRVLVFANDRVESRMVPLPAPVRARFEGPVKDEGERHKRMQTTLDEGAGAEIVGQANTRVHQGTPTRNLAAYVERQADGTRDVLVTYRTEVAKTLRARLPPGVASAPFEKLLGTAAKAGFLHVVFVLHREDGQMDVGAIQVGPPAG